MTTEIALDGQLSGYGAGSGGFSRLCASVQSTIEKNARGVSETIPTKQRERIGTRKSDLRTPSPKASLFKITKIKMINIVAVLTVASGGIKWDIQFQGL